MKLSSQLVLRAVNAAFEFNAENDHAAASVSYSKDSLVLGLSIFSEEKWAYYKVSTQFTTNDPIYADSHEENLAGFLLALESHTRHV